MGKAHALLEQLSESAEDPDSAAAVEDVMDTAFTQLRAADMSTVAACALTGRSRATHYRRTAAAAAVVIDVGAGESTTASGGQPVPSRRLRRPPPCTITEAERVQVLAVLNSEQYRDLAIPQVWARELDEGRYWCSQSSMYRIARACGQTRERRAQASHPPRVRPELVAHGPSEVWSWDITALKGPRNNATQLRVGDPVGSPACG